MYPNKKFELTPEAKDFCAALKDYMFKFNPCYKDLCFIPEQLFGQVIDERKTFNVVSTEHFPEHEVEHICFALSLDLDISAGWIRGIGKIVNKTVSIGIIDINALVAKHSGIIDRLRSLPSRSASVLDLTSQMQPPEPAGP